MFTLSIRYNDKNYTFFSKGNTDPEAKLSLSNNTKIKVYQDHSYQFIQFIMVWDCDVSEYSSEIQKLSCFASNNINEIGRSIEALLNALKEHKITLQAVPNKEVAVSRIIDLSIYHLNDLTRANLTTSTKLKCIEKIKSPETEGALVHFDKEEIENLCLPECLIDCLNFAISQKADTIRFEKGIPPIPQLRVFE